jgi:CheY-like chemotaxis protein
LHKLPGPWGWMVQPPNVVVIAAPDVARLLQANLRKSAGATVRTAGSAPEALALLAEERPSAVVVDTGSSHLDIMETVKVLKTSPVAAGIKVVFVDGRDPQRMLDQLFGPPSAGPK